MKSIAIIGAGLAGLSLASSLAGMAKVQVFDKARGVGGRMSTRLAEPFGFNHGAQFFTARSDAFQKFLQAYIDSGIVAPWEPKLITLEPHCKPYKRSWFEPHYVALPGMNALARELSGDLTVNLQTEIRTLQSDADKWQLLTSENKAFGGFDWVVTALPAPQAEQLLPDSFAEKKTLCQASMLPCFALMLGFSQNTALGFDAAVVKNSPISWISTHNTPRSKTGALCLTAHSSNEWAHAHLEKDLTWVASELETALRSMLTHSLPAAEYSSLHRWRYARTETALTTGHLIDDRRRLAVCGDWCLGQRVEDAFLSGSGLADQLGRFLK